MGTREPEAAFCFLSMRAAPASVESGCVGGGECYEPADRWHIVKAGSQVESRASAEASWRCVLLWQLWRLAACGGQHYEPPACCRPLASCEDWVPSRRLGTPSNQFFVSLIPPTQEGTVASTTSSRQLADCRRKNGEAGLPTDCGEACANVKVSCMVS